jgi:putative phosphoribosyl transferase
MSSSIAIPKPRPVQLELGSNHGQSGIANPDSPVSRTLLNGELTVPAEALGLVVFAHGSGSSRHSRRNRAVAEALQQARLGTLLLDLLTEREERADIVSGQFRFDIPLLADRVVGAVDWAQAAEPGLPIGVFGASTGAAAALIAASRRPAAVRAVVSRGGRPDLAADALDAVVAPTLLIVGGRDDIVLELNRAAFERLKGPKALQIVPGATHLFEEPGALARVAQLARDWFVRDL